MNWIKNHKIASAIIGLFVLAGLGGVVGDEEPATEPVAQTTTTQQGTIEPAPDPTSEAPEPEPTSEGPEMTRSQENAVGMARSYLDTAGFSRSGLIDQLEFEGFDNEDAIFAVDHIDVDWKQQAVRTAEAYLDTQSFSRQGLIDQLEFEGFTTEQATHAVDELGF